MHNSIKKWLFVWKCFETKPATFFFVSLFYSTRKQKQKQKKRDLYVDCTYEAIRETKKMTIKLN